MPLLRKGAPSAPPIPVVTAASDPGALLDGGKSERWSAARALTHADDVPLLSAALSREEDASVREAILTSLCLIATPQSAVAIAPLVRSDDASVRRGALDALRAMPHAAAPILFDLLNDPDSDVRLLSCDIARALPGPQATALLCDRLAIETEVNVCISAAEVLTEAGELGAVAVLQSLRPRFPGEAFLHFAIDAAIERISASNPSGA